MAKSKIDWKGLMLQKGERIGLWTAAAIAGLLIFGKLIWPGAALFSASPAANKGKLDSQAKGVENGLTGNEKGIEPLRVMPAFSFDDAVVDAGRYPLPMPFFPPYEPDDSKRRQPVVKNPVEFAAAVIMGQIRSYVLTHDAQNGTTQIAVLKNVPLTEKEQQQQKIGEINDFVQALRKAARGGRMDPGKLQQIAPPDLKGGGTKNELMVIGFDELTTKNLKPADQIHARRMAIVVGAFPWKEQVEEFRRALHYRTLGELFADSERDSLPHFLGLEVQRRATNKKGKTSSDWQPLDLDASYHDLVLNYILKRFQPDEANLKSLIFDGLVMPRPMLFSGNGYPPLEAELPPIKETLKELADRNAPPPLPPPPRPDKDLKIFNPDGGARSPKDEAPKPEKPGEVAKPGADKPSSATGTSAPTWDPPKFCLLRFVDVTIEPGFIYEYRMRIRVANPNFGKVDQVAFPALAENKELPSSWVELGVKVETPQEQYFYAAEPGPPSPKTKDSAMIQIHRWFETMPINMARPHDLSSVADWIVADKVPVNRGEFLGRLHKPVEVPIWSSTQDRLIAASNPREPRGGITVSFDPGNGGPILVDFEGGKDLRHIRDPADKRGVTDTAAYELLLLSPDGKLLARDSHTDGEDKERLARVEHYKAQVKKANEKEKKEIKPGADKASPFGEKPKPGG